MRLDLDYCRDPDLLVAEARRLQSVIASSEPTLTDAERAALTRAIETLEGVEYMDAFSVGNDATAAATLRGLLERLK